MALTMLMSRFTSKTSIECQKRLIKEVKRRKMMMSTKDLVLMTSKMPKILNRSPKTSMRTRMAMRMTSPTLLSQLRINRRVKLSYLRLQRLLSHSRPFPSSSRKLKVATTMKMMMINTKMMTISKTEWHVNRLRVL